jgi:hypothetical protein
MSYNMVITDGDTVEAVIASNLDIPELFIQLQDHYCTNKTTTYSYARRSLCDWVAVLGGLGSHGRAQWSELEALGSL